MRQAVRESEYKELITACDQVLSESDSRSRAAVSWLHILREHPTVLDQYESIFRPQEPVRVQSQQSPFFRRTAGRLLRRAKSAGLALQSIWSRFRSPPLPTDVDLLIVSHLIGADHAGRPYDFYYGDVPTILASRGLKVLIVLVNHTMTPLAHLQRWSPMDVQRVVLPVGGPRPRWMRRTMSGESDALRAMAGKEESALKKKVLLRASEEARSDASLAAFAIGEEVGRIAGRTNAGSIVTTYEGHAWERLAFASARKHRPGIRCVGYHQACLFQLQHAMKRPLAARFNPDRVVTAGPVTARLLTQSSGFQGIPVSVFGSDRGESDTSGSSYQTDVMRSKKFRVEQPTVLVLPEGMLGECRILFEFSLRAALLSPGLTFRWRLHPLVSFAEIFEAMPSLKDLPANIQLSRAALQDDLASCGWALYRGTTAVFKAVTMGIRPVYVGRPGEMTIDSLFELDHWKKSVKSPQEFLAIVASDAAGHDEKDEVRTAYEYCRSYFSPFDADALTRAALGPIA